MLKKQEETATTLCQIAQKIVFGIKSKYSYSDSEVKVYLQGYTDCAEDNQKTLEKRDKMLRDTVEELCEAKQLLRETLPILRAAFFANYKDTNAANELYDKIGKAVGGADHENT